MFIRPALDPAGSDGARLRVRDPETMDFLAAEGEEKPGSEYWLRRVLHGDVEEVKAEARNLDGTPASMEREPLKLSDDERASLGKLEPVADGESLEYTVGVSDALTPVPQENDR